MKRNKFLFLKRKGSNLNCIDFEEVNDHENNNGSLGPQNPDKLPVLSTATDYDLAEKLAAPKKNTFLITSLHKSRPCTLKDVSWKGFMLPPKPSWAITDPVDKKKNKLRQDKYQLSTQTEKILPQINYTARIVVDTQLECENRKREISQKTRKKLHFRTKELSVLKALKPKGLSQVQTKRHEKEFTEKYCGSLAPKHIHQERFKKQISNEKFPVLTKLSLVHNREQKQNVKEKISLPWFPSKKDFLRAGRLYNKLSTQSDLKEVGQECNDLNLPDQADLALDSANVSDMSDIELEKPKLRTSDSKKESKKFNLGFSNSRKKFLCKRNSWALNEVQKVNTQEVRSVVNDGLIEIFLPPI